VFLYPKFNREFSSYTRIKCNGIDVGIGMNHEQCVSSAIVNPNQFSRFTEFVDFLLKFLTPEQLNQARISRIDFAFEVEIPFAACRQGIDVKRKRRVLEFQSDREMQTGFVIGTGDSKICGYDPAKRKGSVRQKKDAHRCPAMTRIEHQMRGKRLKQIVSGIADLNRLKALADPEFKQHPFKDVVLNSVKVIKPASKSKKDPPAICCALATVTETLHHQPFKIAKRSLSQRGLSMPFLDACIQVTPQKPKLTEMFSFRMAEYMQGFTSMEHQAMKRNKTFSRNGEPYIPLRVAAEMLGCDVVTLERWISKIPDIQIHANPFNRYRSIKEADLACLQQRTLVPKEKAGPKIEIQESPQASVPHKNKGAKKASKQRKGLATPSKQEVLPGFAEGDSNNHQQNHGEETNETLKTLPNQ
jgi:hypothetical protein